MPRDIRSYFTTKKPTKPVIADDDEDVIPESPDVQIKNKKKESRKKRCISDSDEELFESKKKKPPPETNKPSAQKGKTPDKPVLKEVKAVDLFGSAPIKRTEPLVKKVKKKTEIGIHSDEEFDKSLLEVDAVEELAAKDAKEEKLPVNTDKEKEIYKDKSPMKDALKEKHHRSESKHKHHKSYDKHTDKHVKHEASKDNHHNRESLKQHKKKDMPKDKSPKKLNGDSNSQELKTKYEKSNYSDTKKHKDNVSPAKQDKTQSVPSVNFEKKEKNEKDNHKSKDLSQESKVVENGESSSKKRDFSEFISGDNSVAEDDDEKPKKKKKHDKSLNESVLTDEERHERKMYSAALYKNYLNRSGPKHLGAKEIPEGRPDCLANCAFLLTGVLDSFERDEIAAAIAKYGGCIKSGISKKVTHVLAGEDAGPAKMAKAEELGIKIIGEDEFLQMITDSVKKTSSKPDIKKEKSPSRRNNKEKKESYRTEKDKKSPKDKEIKLDVKTESKNHVRNKSQESNKNEEVKSKSPKKENYEKKVETKDEIKEGNEIKPSTSTKQDSVTKLISDPSKTSSSAIPTANTNMWVEKYKPQNIKQIIGQHGDASNVKKLINWLTRWYVNRKAKLPKPSPWSKNDDGGFYKAALLSGPPGVGKTTTVALVCKELGFDMVEFNASDTRNKTLIKQQIGELLTTTSLSAFAKGDTGKQAVTKKHVLVMDEVDGMAGNEDRGGLQEVIALIKSTAVPIIFMCNDRNSQKMRSLVNYCYDLRFSRPRVEQIKSAMMSICCKEGIKIPPAALTQLIVAANQDVRQTLNLLSMWAIDPNLTDSDRLQRDAQSGKKDVKLGPWEAVRKVFSAEEHKTMSINDKSDLFFYDYSLAPLFVFENYIHVSPHCPKNEVLSRLSEAADSISMGDLVDARIRGSQAWGLLPIQAMYSSVIPGHRLSGHVSGQIGFPGWLGKNSSAGKMQRLAQEIHAHTRLSTSGSKSSIFLDYAPHLRDAIVNPLLKDKSEGIEKSLEVLESYHLLREDLASLIELSLWSGQRNPMILIDSKIKAAMTRTYNKKAMALPYAPGSIKKGRAKDNEDEEEEIEGDQEEDSDPENDVLIKKKKTKEDKPSASKEKPSTSKEKPGTSTEKSSTSKDKPGSSKKKK